MRGTRGARAIACVVRRRRRRGNDCVMMTRRMVRETRMQRVRVMMRLASVVWTASMRVVRMGVAMADMTGDVDMSQPVVK